jgi:hypothetical protein
VSLVDSTLSLKHQRELPLHPNRKLEEPAWNSGARPRPEIGAGEWSKLRFLKACTDKKVKGGALSASYLGVGGE